MIKFQEKSQTERRMEGQDRQNLFYRNLPATARGPKTTDDNNDINNK